MANSQHRCVFVGNIPYDATEEQLIQICEEVGPVVSFRLVIDRETGKPKGYGFCEYKDEETALSARRNLHGYDINGRQLRVDFAENDKNPDRAREQGRGGPGLATNTAPRKQIGGPAVHSDPSLNQAVGLHVAMAAAIVIAETLGSGQTINNLSQNGTKSLPTLGTDPLTLHLAKTPKGQLTEVLTELKALATQNKEQARQLLLAHPQLSKAILQAHIMLKAVPPHMMPNAQLLPGQHAHPPVHGGQLSQLGQLIQQSSMQPLSGLPPIAQNKVPLGFMQQSQSQPSSSLVPSQYAAPPQPRFPTPLPAQHPVLHYSTLSGPSAAGNIQSLHPQHSSQLVVPIQPSIMTHKPSSSIGTSIIPNNGSKDHENSIHLSNNPGWGLKVDHHHHPNIASGLHETASFNKDKDQIIHPSKLLKMEDGRGASFSPADVNLPASVPLSENHILKAGPTDSQKPNVELPTGAESALLQQVLSLTPEQLSSLSPEQQQQVIQLQQMLRQST